MTTDINPKDTHLEDRTDHAPSSFTRRVLLAAGITITLLLILLLLWYAVDVLMLVFAGILVAIFLRGLSDTLSERTGLSGGWSLAVVCLALVALIGLGGWLLAPSIAEQVDQLSEVLVQTLKDVDNQLHDPASL